MDADPRRAGREAARQARVRTNPALLVVFCSGPAGACTRAITGYHNQTLAVLAVA
jgi:hypothetical protein